MQAGTSQGEHTEGRQEQGLQQAPGTGEQMATPQEPLLGPATPSRKPLTKLGPKQVAALTRVWQEEERLMEPEELEEVSEDSQLEDEDGQEEAKPQGKSKKAKRT